VSDHPNARHDPALCTAARERAAVALLGRREPAPDVLAHLEQCPPCHEEYLGLAELAPLLDAAREARPADGTDPSRPGERAPSGTAAGPADGATAGSPLLLERLMAHVRRRRRRRRTALVLAAVAVAAAAVPVVRVVTADEPALAPAPSRIIALGDVTSSDGRARAQVWVRAWEEGSAVTVVVDGGPDGHHCRIVVHDSRGAATEAGVWTMHAPRSAYTEEVTTTPGDIRRVELVDDGTGDRIADVPVHPA